MTRSAPPAPRVLLEIGTLRLNGFADGHRARFETELQASLQRLLTEHGPPGGPRRGRRHVAEPIRHDAADDDAEAAARAVAARIWSQLGDEHDSTMRRRRG